jgi:hypothetical protein
VKGSGTKRRVIDDEILELFGDDPEALAIIDAVAATGSVHRRRTPTRKWVALAAAVLGAAIAVGALTRQSSHAGVIDSALGALPTNRIIRVAIRDEAPAGELVNLRSGTAKSIHHTIVEWFDPQTGRRRLRDELAGVAINDVMYGASGGGSGFAERTLARFPALYRAELLQAVNSDVSQRRLNGAPIYWIRFQTRTPLRAVAVDLDTYKPVRAVFADGEAIRSFRISELTALPAATITIPKPQQAARAAARRTSLHPSTPDELRRSGLTGPAVLERLLGPPLRTFVGTTDESPVGEYIFSKQRSNGALPDRYVRVQEASVPQLGAGWSAPIVSMTRVPGSVFLMQDGKRWTGFVTAPHRAFRIISTLGRAELLGIARRLTSVS